MTGDLESPVVILGGFLSPGVIYTGMRKSLAALAGQPVSVVPTLLIDWIPSISLQGWRRILDKLDRTVREALLHSPGKRITLVAHSAGGVLARIYLSPEPFLKRRYSGLEHVAHLITLGSPHLNRGGPARGGRMSRWVEQRYPGAYFTPQVRYTCVAGKFIQGDPLGSPQQRTVSRIYAGICADAYAWGDAVVPVASALLPGAESIILDGVSHYSLFGEPWLGSQEVLPRWWDAAR